MKKTLVVLIGLCLLACSVTAFAAPAGLVWCGWAAEEAATKPLVQTMMNDWNDANPGSKVSWVGWPWAQTLQQLVIRLQGSENIDIAQVDTSMFPTLVSMDAVVDLGTLLDKGWLDANFTKASLGFGTTKGRLLGMPWTTASIGMVYNPTLLASVGYKEPPSTVAEFEDCLAKLRAKDKDLIPYALSTKDATATADFGPWLWTFGGSVFDDKGQIVVDSKAGVDTLAWYKKLADNGYIKANMSRFDARQLFAQGKVGFYDDAIMARGIAQSNGVKPEALDATIRPMLRPVVKAGIAPSSAMWGHLLVIFKKSANQAKAAEFLKHVISERESIMYFETSGMLPVMKSALANPKVTSNIWAKSWSAITSTGRNNEFMLYANNAELTNIVSEEVQAVIIGKKTPEKAAADMKSRLVAAGPK
jgi:ABC-type glycerol-3-phosphate transport system substrate-binding protein